MLTSVTAWLLCERLAPGSLYTHLLALKGIVLQSRNASDALWTQLQALDVMQSQVECFASSMTIDEAIQAFARSHHRGFPVTTNDKLVGIITQSDLSKATDRQLPGNSPILQIATLNPVTIKPNASLAHVLDSLTRYKLSRLPVVDNGKLVGIITRSDILRVEAEKLRG